MTVRFATDEERAQLAATSDLTPNSIVLAWDPPGGGPPVFAVVRTVVEVDPWHFNGHHPRTMWLAGLAIENFLKGSGVAEYYHRVKTTDEAFISLLQKMGAENTSEAPEFRFKRRL